MKKQEQFLLGEKGFKIYWCAYLPEEPKAVVQIVHGFAEHSGRYTHLIDALYQANYAIYINDHRGHGKSEGKRNHIKKFNEYVKDCYRLTKIIKEKHPQLPLFLLGHSMGSFVSQRFTILHQDELKGLILSGSGTRASDSPQLLVTLVKILAKVLPILKVPSGINPTDISSDPLSVQDYINDPLINFQKLTVSTAAAFLNHYPEIKDQLKKIRIPILLQRGKNDVLTLGFDELVEDVKNTELTIKVYDSAKHEIYTEKKEIREQAFQDLISWLDKHLD